VEHDKASRSLVRGAELRDGAPGETPQHLLPFRLGKSRKAGCSRGNPGHEKRILQQAEEEPESIPLFRIDPLEGFCHSRAHAEVAGGHAEQHGILVLLERERGDEGIRQGVKTGGLLGG